MPSFVPTLQQSQESEYGQWTYFTDYYGNDPSTSRWIAVGDAFDENGNYIFTNALSNVLPLIKAKGAISITLSLRSLFNFTVGIISLNASYKGCI